MPRLLTALLLLVVITAVSAVQTQCSPPIPGCTCDTGILKCAGAECTTLPVSVPSTITEFVFDSCTFATSIDSIPYPNATVFILVNSHGGLSIEDGAFNQLTKLNSLELRGNQLTAVNPALLQGLQQLRMLVLSDNKLTSIVSDTFSSVPALEHLELDSNPTLSLSTTSFTGLDNLQNLQLQNCGLNAVPKEAIQDLKQLRVLNIHGNKIDSLADADFEALDELQELVLNDCALREISADAMSGLSKLISLDLGYNNLTSLDSSVLKPCYKSLRNLFLNHNQFAVIPHDLVPWSQLEQVRLEANPWMCDCSNAWIHLVHPNTHENVTCYTPAEVKGQSVYNATLALGCSVPGRSDKSTIVMAIVIPLIILCVLLLAYYVYKVFETKKRKDSKKNVRYSSVYRDTVETVSGKPKGRPMSEL